MLEWIEHHHQQSTPLLSVSDGGPLYLRLHGDGLVFLLFVKDVRNHLITVSNQRRRESLTAKFSLVIFLEGPGSVRVLERTLQDISVLTTGPDIDKVGLRRFQKYQV